MARTLNSPADILNYTENVCVFRSFKSGNSRIIEAQWGATSEHPAEAVSFVDGADKLTSLRGGGNVSQETPQPAYKALKPFEVLNLLPSSVVKSLKDATDPAAVKRFEVFKLTPILMRSEGASFFNDIEAAGLMTSAQNSDALALWPAL